MRLVRLAPIAILVPTLLAGCNSGLAAIFGSAGDDENANAPAAVTAFNVQDQQTSPATLRFRVIDADNDAAVVSLYYQVVGGSTQLMTQLGGADNPQAYAGSPNGTEHVLSWDFAAEADLPSDGAYMEAVNVWAQIDGTSSIVLGANASQLGLGNDAPVIDTVNVPTNEASGVVPVGLSLSDSSSDLVDMRVEWQVAGDAAWQLARPGGMTSTPPLAITGFSAPEDGVDLTFFWDTDADLPLLERDVVLRFTPIDPTIEGDGFVTPPFRVDNNDAPILDLDNGLIVFGTNDRSGGIAVPFDVRDAEGDDLQVVFQWRRELGTFPALPSDPEDVFAIQQDPALRRQYQVCTTRESWLGGRALPVSEDRVRLPEIGTVDLPLSRHVLPGRSIEIMRHAELPVDVTTHWDNNPLTHVVDAVPLGSGLEVLVLEQPSSANWRVRRVRLATGEIIGKELASGGGIPTALAIDVAESSLFVASTNAGAWNVHRIDLAEGTVSGPSSAPTIGADGVRGLAALSSVEAVVSVDDRVERVHFLAAGTRVEAVASGLATPWGVARDPHDQSHVIVAEHGADRIVSVRLVDGFVRDLLPADPSAAPREVQLGFPEPRGIAFDRGGERLQVVVEVGDSREVRAWNRGSAYDLDGSGFADPLVYRLATLPGLSMETLAVCDAGLRLSVDSAADRIVAIGGIQQRRTVESVEEGSNVVVLDAALDPPLDEPLPWRTSASTTRFSSSPGGTSHIFAWDSRDVLMGGGVFLRAVAFDSEFGIDAETDVPLQLESVIGARRLALFDLDPEGLQQVQAVDIDGDGDQDIVVSESQEISVLRQLGPGRFADALEPLPLDLAYTNRLPLVFADLDEDGLLDLIHRAEFIWGDDPPELDDLGAERYSAIVQIFYGTAPGAFANDAVEIQLPEAVHGGIINFGELRALDEDGDGDLDLVLTRPGGLAQGSQNQKLEGLYLLRQLAPRVFDEPVLLDNDPLDMFRSATTSFALGDIDGDGFRDVLCAQNAVRSGGGGTGGLSILYGAPGGYESEVVVLGKTIEFDPRAPELGAARSVALADLDLDGDLDLITAAGTASAGGPGYLTPDLSGSILIHFQAGPREFPVEPVRISLRPATILLDHVAGLVVQDANHDGLPDLVVATSAGPRVYLASAPGVYDATEHITIDLSEPFNAAVSEYPDMPLIDIDGDGDLDVLFHDRMSGEVSVVLQVGSGVESFATEPLIHELEGFTDGLTDSETADLDGDGDLDVFTANCGLGGSFASNTITVFEQVAPRTFASIPQSLGLDVPMLAPARTIAGDLDSDGDFDVIAVSVGTNELHVFRQEGPGSFGDVEVLAGPEPVYENSPVLDKPTDILVSDLDLDGDLDLLSASNYTSRLIVFEQGPTGTLELLPTFDHRDAKGEYLSEGPRGVAAEDLDGDGVRELIGAFGIQHDMELPDRNSFAVFEGGGALDPKSVGAPVMLDHGGRGDVEVVDLDGDGRLDLLVGGLEDPGGPLPVHVLRISFGRADGGYDILELPFLATASGFAQETRKSLQAVDVDVDGDLDLVVLSGSGPSAPGTVSVYEQLAPRLFAQEALITGPQASNFHVRDIDGDGELDLNCGVYQLPFVARATTHWGNE